MLAFTNPIQSPLHSVADTHPRAAAAGSAVSLPPIMTGFKGIAEKGGERVLWPRSLSTAASGFIQSTVMSSTPAA